MIPFLIWTVWCIEWAFLSFHISVTVFIVVQIRKGKRHFSSAFFAIYLAQSFANCGSYFNGSWLLRTLQYKLMPKFILELPGCGVIYTTAGGYFTYFEYVAHFAISANRYTVIIYPEYKSKIWDGKVLKVIMLGLFLIPFVLIAVRLAGATIVVENDDGFAIKRTTPWVNTISSAISVTLSLSTSLGSCLLELRTWIAYRRFAEHRRKELREDYMLLLYAIFGLVSQLLMTTYYLYMGTIGNGNIVLFQAAQALYPFLVDLLALSGSVFLISTRYG